MAIDLFSSDHEGAVISEINMTPLVDVMLVLLIVFMVTLPVIHDAARVQLPQASSQHEDLRTAHVDVAIDAAGEMRWNGEALDDPAVVGRLAAAAKIAPQPEIRLAADGGVRYERVARLLSAAESAGLTKVSFVTDPNAM
ncbi:ExbD/TolR family protein [Paraburkholderia azotifigens]|uniref:ExbD/TolR family protein n=1 Tax=Paraburkholderia azotifigens TaxID=2057004 RepID=UPI0038BB7E35